MRSLTIADIKEILRVEIRKSILHSRHVHLGTNEFSEESVSLHQCGNSFCLPVITRMVSLCGIVGLLPIAVGVVLDHEEIN